MSGTTPPTSPSDPDIGLLQSRTFWAAILTPIVSGLAAKYGAGLDNATVGAITTLLGTLAMIGMRYVTNRTVTGITGPAK